MSYYYCMMELQLTDMVETCEIQEHEKINAMQKIEALMQLDAVIDICALHRGSDVYKNNVMLKVSSLTNQMIEKNKIVTLFRQRIEIE